MEFNLEEFCEGGKGRDKEGERENQQTEKGNKTKQIPPGRGGGSRLGEKYTAKKCVNGWMVGLSKPGAIGCCGFWPYWIGGLASVVPQ